MESTERLQRRIGTLDELHTIVRTMKALAATSIRQYEQAAKSLAEYHRAVDLGLQVVLQDVQSAAPEIRRGDSPGLGVVVFGSDHGLCGRFNEDIAAHALQTLDECLVAQDQHRVLVIGARVAEHLQLAGRAIESTLPTPGAAPRITATVQQILLQIDKWRAEGEITRVQIFHNRHIGRDSYRPTNFNLLPIDFRSFRRNHHVPWPSRRLPTFNMDRNTLAKALLRQYFFVSIFYACAESQASEHASRLNTMQAAEKNLDEHLNEVRRVFRSLRQEAITTELLDVISGFEAATSSDSDGDR